METFQPWHKRQVSDRKVVFSGIQPTGTPHLGNFFGAIEKWVELQNDPKDVVYYSIVDLHSISLPQDPEYLRNCVLSMTATLLASGLDPSKCVLFQQSSVPHHAELSWILGCKTTLARLGHFPQWKSKAGKDKQGACVGLYTYPVLQAADILLYKTTHVPVGDDQVPHLELAQHLAKLFNLSFGTSLVSPEPVLGQFKRIKSLREPDKKMSKSDSDPKSRIEITDTKEDIAFKLKKAVTDFTSAVTYDPENRPGVSNLVDIHAAATGQRPEDIPDQVTGMTTAEYKMVVAAAVNSRLETVRDKYLKLIEDKSFLRDVLNTGATKAKLVAEETCSDVKRCVGLI